MKGATPKRRSCIARRSKWRGECWDPQDKLIRSDQQHLAIDLAYEGKYSDAEKVFREVLEIDRRTLGSDHPDVLSDMNNLGSHAAARGKVRRGGETVSRFASGQTPGVRAGASRNTNVHGKPGVGPAKREALRRGGENVPRHARNQAPDGLVRNIVPRWSPWETWPNTLTRKASTRRPSNWSGRHSKRNGEHWGRSIPIPWSPCMVWVNS